MAHRIEIGRVQPTHAFEIARVADIHRVRNRLHRRTRLEYTRVEIRRHDIVRVGCGDEPRDRQTRAFAEQAGGQITKVSAGRADDDFVRG